MKVDLTEVFIAIITLFFALPSYSQTDHILVALVENEELGFHYISEKGEVIIGKSEGNKHNFSKDGLLRKEKRGVGFVNTKDEWVVAPTWVEAGDFSEGFAAVAINAYGYINKKGELKIPMQFGHAFEFSDGLAAVRKLGIWGYIDTTGTMVIKCQYQTNNLFKNGYVAARLTNKEWHILNRSGSVVGTLGKEFTTAGGCSDNRIRVGKADASGISSWGYVDTLGRTLIPCKFKFAYDFSEGLARVKDGKLWGFIDPSGMLRIPAKFSEATDFHQGVASAKYKGKWGLLDTNGNWLVEPQFDGFRGFHEGFAAAKQNGRWGYIDKSGNWKIHPAYKMAKDFVRVNN